MRRRETSGWATLGRERRTRARIEWRKKPADASAECLNRGEIGEMREGSPEEMIDALRERV